MCSRSQFSVRGSVIKFSPSCSHPPSTGCELRAASQDPQHCHFCSYYAASKCPRPQAHLRTVPVVTSTIDGRERWQWIDRA